MSADARKVQIAPGGRLFLIGAVLGCVVSACDKPTGPSVQTVPLPPDVRPWIAASAANQVDSRGHFIFPEPTPPGAEPIISPRRAEELAHGFVRTWLWEESPGVLPPGAVSFRAALLAEHGAPIAWRRLEPVRPARYYAESPYEALPGDVPVPVRRLFGPYYVMPLAADGVLVVGMFVSAYNTDLSISPEGKVLLPAHSGNSFNFLGIPRSDQRPFPIWPEEAVRLAATATGARIIELPQLVTIGFRFSPQLSRWKLTLDRRIRFRHAETGEEEESDLIYVGLWTGYRLTFFLPHGRQPAEHAFTYSDREGAEHHIRVRLRPSVPVDYRVVVPIQD